MKIDTNRLVDAKGLLDALFEENCRPTVRWVRRMQKRGLIPVIKLGHRSYFDPAQVRAYWQQHNVINPATYVHRRKLNKQPEAVQGPVNEPVAASS